MEHILAQLRGAADVRESMSEVRSAWESQSYQKLLFHIYSGELDREVLSATARALAEEFNGALIAGTISAGEIMDGRLMEPGILVSAMLFADTDVRITTFDGVSGREQQTGDGIRALIDGIPDIRAAELLLPGTAFNTRILFEEIERCAPGVQIFGGYAGGHSLECEEHFVFDEKGIYEDAVLVVTYAGENFHVQADKSVGWQTLGMPFKVTKADENRLIEINGSPAVEIYEKYLKIDRNDHFAENTFEFPLIAEVEDDELLRHTITVDPDGALILAGYVTEGMDILLSYGNPSAITERVNERLEEIRQFVPEAILLYSCSVRKSFWESFVDIEMRPFERMARTAGFHTWGEVKRNNTTGKVLEYNITLLSIAMREGDAKEPPAEAIRVDDSVLKGQASLIKRLSTLVSATTTELQKALEIMSDMNERMTDMSIRDALTGLYNRGKIEMMIYEELDHANIAGEPVSLVMLDIDHFKRVNDTYGHAAGDIVLKEVSAMMAEAVGRIPDAAAGRWGGEEFFAMLSATGADDAMAFAEALRRSVEERSFPEVERLTVSMGVITSDGNGSRRDIFTKVDDALYASKENGRNRVTKAL